MIFIDTGAFIARYVERDQYHSQAVDYWRRLQEDGVPCVTSNLVLHETFTTAGAANELSVRGGAGTLPLRVLDPPDSPFDRAR